MTEVRASASASDVSVSEKWVGVGADLSLFNPVTFLLKEGNCLSSLACPRGL